jgi:hypothetical protein
MEVNRETCELCGQPIGLEATGSGVNYCRGLLLLPVIETEPGLTGWELGQRVGLSYALAVKATGKLRATEAVRFEAEDRAQGGIRFRYYPADAEATARFHRGHDATTRTVAERAWINLAPG